MILSNSEEETRALGEKLGRRLKAGDLLAFRGGLGAGKTTLVKGIAVGFGIEETVTSPTFPIISEYRGRLPFRHVDLYRINGREELEELGLPELLADGGVTVVEWSEKMNLPEEAIVVEIEILSANERRFTLRGLEL